MIASARPAAAAVLRSLMVEVAVQVIDDLTMLVRIAKHRADKRTPFEKAQHRLARIYNLPSYQNTVTGLLVLVSLPALNFVPAQKSSLAKRLSFRNRAAPEQHQHSKSRDFPVRILEPSKKSWPMQGW
jgi:hypothetical protein